MLARMLPVRSFKQGQVTSDEVRDLLARMRDAGEHKTGEILEGMAAIGSYAGDILVADAGLRVAGHLDLFREASNLRVARQCTDQNVPTR